jgi:hypothetical protein
LDASVTRMEAIYRVAAGSSEAGAVDPEG